ncbi:dolichyl-diphosphooligosaccharide--protein glycosyltransferase subunit 2-like [Watersipora subatra]|uniref:dolichyl-diphosphooligosaccharide--protein glycosyltransferase subunit 2-like n=1 Tax=Watersipora subatra TaxID=2589382 RepID=UPI00355B8C5F
MNSWFCVIGLLLVVTRISSTTVSSYLTADDKERMRSLFSSSPFKDSMTAYWSLRGQSLLDAIPKDSSSMCNSLKALNEDSLEAIYSRIEAASLIKCSMSHTTAQENILKAALTEKNVIPLYQAYTALNSLKVKVDAKQVNDALETALKTDDTPTSMGYAFLLTTALNMDLEKRYQLIEDVYAQADVYDGKYLQFEGGLFTTSLVVESSYKLAAAAKKAPTLKAEQVMQLANYLLSRKHVSKVKSSAQLLAALKVLSSNEFQIPVAISLDKAGSLISPNNKKIAIRVGTVLGDSIGKVTLTADSARHITDDAVVLSKKQLTVASDPSVYNLDFTNVKAPFGFYKVLFTASLEKPDSKLVGLKGSVQFKVVTDVKLDSVEIGVGDKDQSGPKTRRVEYPAQAKQLDADTHQKLFMSFYVKSAATSEAMKVHQAFVRLTNQKTGQEIIYVATPDEGTKQYTFDLDVGAKEKEFESRSGLYKISLVVGDAVVVNPIDWPIADVKLTFLGSPPTAESGDQYQPKPVIQHEFRQPETRPSAAVSNVFTILCATPFILMLLLWLRIGVNISNFPVSISAIGFHVGLAGIFFLYYLYWTQLNMFETVRYLAVLGVPTFLFGNQLLSGVASKRKAK